MFVNTSNTFLYSYVCNEETWEFFIFNYINYKFIFRAYYTPKSNEIMPLKAYNIAMVTTSPRKHLSMAK